MVALCIEPAVNRGDFDDLKALLPVHVLANGSFLPSLTCREVRALEQELIISQFRPDVGSARVDFPGGSAETLYKSVQRVLELPPSTRVFSGK